MEEKRYVLVRTVEAAWQHFDLIELTNIWDGWCLVLYLIIKDEGRDRLLVARKRKLFRALSDKAKGLTTKMAEAPKEGEQG